MKISDFISVLSCDTVTVTYGGLARELDTHDPLMMEAYGDFLVEKATICAVNGETICEISVKTTICKAG